MVPDSKARTRIARDRNVSGNSASAKNKAVVAAKNVGAVNKADGKPDCIGPKKRRELPPAVLLVHPPLE